RKRPEPPCTGDPEVRKRSEPSCTRDRTVRKRPEPPCTRDRTIRKRPELPCAGDPELWKRSEPPCAGDRAIRRRPEPPPLRMRGLGRRPKDEAALLRPRIPGLEETTMSRTSLSTRPRTHAERARCVEFAGTLVPSELTFVVATSLAEFGSADTAYEAARV